MPEYLQKVIDDIYQDFELDRVTAYRTYWNYKML